MMRVIEGFGGDVTPETYRAGADVTHLAVPIAIRGETSEEATAHAIIAADHMMAAAGALSFVRQITSPMEGAYALLANAATALEQLSPIDRAHLLAQSAAASVLIHLLRPWVIGTVDGPMIVPSPGAYRVAVGDSFCLVDAAPATDAEMMQLARNQNRATS